MIRGKHRTRVSFACDVNNNATLYVVHWNLWERVCFAPRSCSAPPSLPHPPLFRVGLWVVNFEHKANRSCGSVGTQNRAHSVSLAVCQTANAPRPPPLPPSRGKFGRTVGLDRDCKR